MSNHPHLPTSPPPHAYWRSLDELAEEPAFQKWLDTEFPHLPAEYRNGPNRRQFLKVMGASFALAGLTACRWPKEHIVPATKRPVNRTPGQTVQYATAIDIAGAATGLLVTSYDGRPIKVEGNEKHPLSRGKTNHWMQASILDLYDPDRSVRPIERGPSGNATNRTWAEFEAFARTHFAALRGKGGAGLAVLSEASSSPSLESIRAHFQATFPQAKWYEYEPISRDNEIEGARQAFRRPVRSHLHLDQADVVVSLDSDFLMMHPAALRYAADFAARRRADDGMMNRLYVFEPALTVTGSMADERHAVRFTRIADIARTLYQLLGGKEVTDAEPALVALANDLKAHRGRGVVVVGPQQPPEVHALAHGINHQLGAVGHTVSYTGEPDAERPTHAAAAAELAKHAASGNVDTLVILGGDPVYTAPADDQWFGRRDRDTTRSNGLLDKIPTRIHLSAYDNKTSQYCTWHVPQAHYLESWGDVRAWDGTISLVQPLIEPLYGGKTPCELVALLCGDKLRTGHDMARRTLGILFDAGQNRDALWNQSLHDGVVPDTAWPRLDPGQPRAPQISDRPTPNGFEVVFRPDYSVYDGRFANNAWLQEWPDPITKLTWDNAALISPTDARRLGVIRNGDQLRIALNGAVGTPINIPACISPGHADGVITLPLGYGRGPAAGVVAADAGVNAYRLRTRNTMSIATGVTVNAVDGHQELVTTQDHHAIQSEVGNRAIQERLPQLVREATLEEYKHHPDFAQHVVHHPPLESLWKEREYPDHKWGMAIDLSTCIGCGACTVACQAENNIPVVGKNEVAMGREMHWIRVDRYFREGVAKSKGQALPVEVVHQPVTCVHCENAPCEQVCPVAATVHDDEGLNVMVYNRCVGTRYCSNNCPYKVRRFNWFYNHHGPYHPRSLKAEQVAKKDGLNLFPGEYKKQPLTEVEKLLENPEVTVRSRGVMEKCTYCVQRISKVKIQARNENRPIQDGEITPACGQACPTNAIVFGDLNDPNSHVRKLHDHPRAYGLLAELNVKPRTAYLAKLRNPRAAGHAGETQYEKH